MPKLDIISGIPAKAIELLEALGYLDVSDLRDADAESLVAELVKANKVLKIMPDDPSESSLRKWLKLVNEQILLQGELLPRKQRRKIVAMGRGLRAVTRKLERVKSKRQLKRKPAPRKPAKRELVNFEQGFGHDANAQLFSCGGAA